MRRSLARLVAAMAVVAGLAVLIAPLCADGMSMASPAAADSVATATGPGLMPAVDGSACATMVVVDTGDALCVPGTVSGFPAPVAPPVPVGALLACIGFVIAIIAAVLGLRPPWSVRIQVIRPAAESPRLLVRHAQSPSLAELCVLRT